ncbi:uncharacterized protein BCR38DRAFT_443511 [Pseudomassariella vexata]|uniref:Uncharacterized protein n=1 Tax=Pseudomassariella vexata TaxID=1141098 RepID=A0A1Y2DLE9_9PEZI|nr:uncharacterized protein BCR38DRAFT_443511 [Pseudomassariella vexata]ORY59979.1 hypothetical protein BCR38DRAFT_443511 [Pseudomassariella vexata]
MTEKRTTAKGNMKFTATTLLALAMATTVISSPTKTRNVVEDLSNLKRDPSGQGFTYIGSDNVARSFDSRFNVLDAAPLDSRSTGSFARSPDAAFLEEAKAAKARALEHTSKPRKERNVIVEGRQNSCVSENCPNDQYCIDQAVNGYNCSWCLIISNGIGNCQT